MKKIVALIFLILVLVVVNFKLTVKADNNVCSTQNLSSCTDPNGPCYQDLTACMGKLQDALNMSVNATKPLQSQLDSMKAQIDAISQSVANIKANVAEKKQFIDKSYKDLAVKEKILYEKVRDFYIKSSYDNPILIFLSSNNASSITQQLAYQKSAEDQDKAIITNLVISITTLQKQKQDLEAEEVRLSSLETSLNAQSAQLDKIVQGAIAYQSSLTSQIAQLSAQQQQLLARKLASLNIPLTAYTTQGGCSSDINPYKDPGFGGAKFGFFTYGVPNRVGLNQYGALGRAQNGETYSQILNDYYQNFHLVCMNNNINVDGYGNMSITNYLKGLGEMPSAWDQYAPQSYQAYEAQIVAAASYAYAYTNNGSGSICTTQSCQVYTGSNKGGGWEQAVNNLSSSQCGGNGVQVMIDNSTGQPIKAWYSSTHGGYEYTSSDIGWSGTDWTKKMQDANGSVNSFADLQAKAYDKGSPWFYCDWGGRSQYNNTAWLTASEVADIANVITLAQKDSSTQSHLSQTDKPNPDGVDTWDAGRVQQELKNRGITPFTSVSSVSVSVDFAQGITNSVTINGDGGSVNFNGSTFKTYFNLRASSNINIVGPLFNVEQR